MLKKILFITLFLSVSAFILAFNLIQHQPSSSTIPLGYVKRQNLKTVVKTIGELEAAHSITIASAIKGDQGKIIDLICDGVYVQPGELLVRLDPSPFEEKLDKLQIQLKEQEAYIKSLEQTLEWESVQAEHKNRTALLELEGAKLELDKITYGDGPQEISRLKATMQKAWLTFDELNAYSNDLKELEAQGFLNHAEIKQAQKKLNEEQEAYELAKQQHDSFIQHVYPMQIKKAETQYKRAQVAQEEILKSGFYNIAKSEALLEQAKQNLADLLMQLKEAQNELNLTEIIAPAQGMVVLREEYRTSQKRKPRVGDSVMKNQPLIDLPDLSSMIIKTRVREVDLFKIGIGKRATITCDAYPTLMFNGKVTSIGVLALTDMMYRSDEKYFEVRIALDESDSRLRPGMTTRATILSEEVQNILTIPLHSVFINQGENYCFILNANHAYEKRNITLGINNSHWIEVKEGVKEGECVCLINPLTH